MAIDGFAHIDVVSFHRIELPGLLAGGRGALAARALGGLEDLVLAVASPEPSCWTYRPHAGGVDVIDGDSGSGTRIELDHSSFEGLVHDYESAPGLLYTGRVRCDRGSAMQLVLWEPALRAMYQGRPVYEPGTELCDRRGRTIDPTRAFHVSDDGGEMADFLHATGYVVVRGLYDAAESAALLAEATALRAEAERGDKLSWWARDVRGADVVSRVTRGASKPALATLFGASRIRCLVDHLAPGFEPRLGEGDGVTLIYKSPEMTEGLSDLPWHRDCGMGGHALMCPLLICSLFLTPANPETGDLVFLPGSWQTSSGYMDPGVLPPQAVRVAAEPGDVTFHFGDVMHAAPAPSRSDLESYRVSAVTDYGRPGIRTHRGAQSYNDALHQRSDGQIEHLANVVRRT